MRKKDIEVDIFIPCFIDQVYPKTGFNMVKVLEKVGCKVNYNPNQTCCGQPAYNAGYFDDAKEVAEKFLSDFSNENRYVVTPSASSAGMVRHGYHTLFAQSQFLNKYLKLQKTVFEFTEFLVDVLGVDKIEGSRFEGKITYHDACSALRECKIFEAPRKLLKNVQGLQLVELKENETCCGFGGTFAAKFEPISTGMAQQKMENAVETGAQYLVSTDYSCIMHLEAYMKKNNTDLKVLHIADVLAAGW